jgi:hypothetical protein
MRRLFEYGGIAAGAILIALGIGATTIGALGVNEVRDNLAREQIVGTPDSTIPGQKVNTGAEAKAFADVMRKHTLESTEGQVYSQMGRYLDENGQATNDEAAAAKDPTTGQPVANQARNIWVTETALTSALNMAFFAERVAFFSIAMGIALLLSGIGFVVLAVAGAVRRPEKAIEAWGKRPIPTS